MLELEKKLVGYWLFFTSKRLQWFMAGIVVGFLLILGYWIRQPIEPGISSVEGYYTPNVQYGPWYLVNNKRLFFPTGEIPLISNYTSGLGYGSIDFTYSYLTGNALILSREVDVEQIGFLYQKTPWQGLLFLPLIALSIYGRLTKAYRHPMSPWAVVVLVAFTAFSNYPMIIWSMTGGFGAPLGWFIFYGVYLFILARRLEPRFASQWMLLLILTLLLAQPTYHTTALVLVVMLVTVGVIQKFVHREYLSTTIIWLAVVAFLTFLIYHAVSFFEDYGRILMDFLADLYRSRDKERLKFSLEVLDVSLWWHAANYVAILVPVIWSGTIIVRRRFRSGMDADVYLYQWSWLLALIPLGFLLFAWDGVFAAYERILQYGTLLSITCVAILLATRRGTLFPLAAVSAVCIFVSVYLVSTFNVATSNYLTTDEKAGIEWIISNKACDQVVFTDFRIGSTFGYWGCFAVIGPNAIPLLAEGRMDIISSLIHNGDSNSSLEAIDTLSTVDGRRPNLILMSRRFLDPHIGFLLPDERVKPMTEAQWAIYRKLEGWNIVVENNTAMVLVRNGP